MTDLSELAAVRVDDVPERALLPMGSYEWVITKQPEMKPTATGSGNMVNFTCKVERAIDDFEDPDELDTYIQKIGPVAGEYRVVGFFVPSKPREDQDEAAFQKSRNNSLRDIIDFCVKVLQLEGNDKTLPELLSEATNQRFLGSIVHEPDNRDSSRLLDRIGKKAPIL